MPTNETLPGRDASGRIVGLDPVGDSIRSKAADVASRRTDRLGHRVEEGEPAAPVVPLVLTPSTTGDPEAERADTWRRLIAGN